METELTPDKANIFLDPLNELFRKHMKELIKTTELPKELLAHKDFDGLLGIG